jgi:DNA adenine methylase
MSFGRYIEPFLGGGSVYLGLAPTGALLSDINADLITTYAQVRYRPKILKDALRQMPVDASSYAEVRSRRPDSGADVALRFLYLNRTAFGGMYRLSRAGAFNVPFGPGRTPATLWTTCLLEEAARVLRGADLSARDFGDHVEQARDGDLVYCDPIYSVAHNENGFVRYNEAVFRWIDQERLAVAAHRAASKGALVLVSNADHPAVSALYPEATRFVFRRQSRLCPQVAYRRTTSECLFALGPPELIHAIVSRDRRNPSLTRFGVERVVDTPDGATPSSDPTLWVGHGIKRSDRR